MSEWVVLVHVATAFWFVAGLVGRDLSLGKVPGPVGVRGGAAVKMEAHGEPDHAHEHDEEAVEFFAEETAFSQELSEIRASVLEASDAANPVGAAVATIEAHMTATTTRSNEKDVYARRAAEARRSEPAARADPLPAPAPPPIPAARDPVPPNQWRH